VCATIIIKDQKTMGNFTLTSSDKNTTSDLASRTVMPAGGTLSNGVENKAGILLRIFNSLFELRQRQTDRNIARFVARSGMRLTDDMEREMTQRFLTGNWSYRQ
jgi:hypothetical protein